MHNNHSVREVLDSLRNLAHVASQHAHTPYSKKRVGAALLLSDGTWVSGVRIESVSFSLVITAPVAACVTSIAAGRTDAVAMALSRPVQAHDILYLHRSPLGDFQKVGEFTFTRTSNLPEPQKMLNPVVEPTAQITPRVGIQLARNTAQHAHVLHSNFPVGCVLRMKDGCIVSGVNVEHHSWSFILCAERTALAAAISAGKSDIDAIYVSCLKDPFCSPCGACRQLLMELAPDTDVWLDRGNNQPKRTSTSYLLPHAFQGGDSL